MAANGEQKEGDTLPSSGILEATMGVNAGGLPPLHPNNSNNSNSNSRAPTPPVFQPFVFDPRHMQAPMQACPMMTGGAQQTLQVNGSAQQPVMLQQNVLPQQSTATAAKTTTTKTGMAKGGAKARYRMDELDILLDACEEVIPIGGSCWRTVLSKFNLRVAPDRQRDKVSLQNKFQNIVNHPKPTGDADCPPHVVRAKRIECQRIEKSKMKTMGTSKDDITADGSDDDELEDPCPLRDAIAKDNANNNDSNIEGEDDTGGNNAGGNNAGGNNAGANGNDSSNVNYTTPAAKRKSKGSSTTQQKKKTGRPKTTGEEEDEEDGNAKSRDNFLQVFLANESAKRKETRRRERRRDRKEGKRDKRNAMMFMSAMQSMTACIVASITGEAPTVAENGTLKDYHTDSSDNDSSSSSSSSSEEEEQPKTKKRKRRL